MMSPAFRPSGRTLVDVLRLRAAEHPDRPALTFLENGETPTESLTYRALDDRARSIAVGIREHLGVGDLAVLLYPSGLEFAAAFLGCLYAGVVPVPAYPPRNARHVGRIEAILRDAEARCILTHSSLVDRLSNWLGRRDPRLFVTSTDSFQTSWAMDWRAEAVPGDSLAFLQYTSGSTGTPKGVMVTHANLLANQRMIQQAFELAEGFVCVSWLPIYHDMGLVGSLLQPLFLGGRCVLMSPTAFLQRPRRWLEAVSSFRAQSTGGPNFAFRLCARAIRDKQRAGLDLSSVDAFFCGSEPINASDLDEFAAAFSEVGLRREALYCCYGMAEATLLATGSIAGRGPVIEEVDGEQLAANTATSPRAGASNVRRIVGCGRAPEGQEVLIVDPGDRTADAGEDTNYRSPLEDGQIGEIWLRGPSIARGYWNKPELTETTFGARVAGSSSGDGGTYLRTGDLGYLRRGELFVTGRLKDLIIIRGRNHYPHDIEATAHDSHPAFAGNASAAFALSVDGEDRLVVVQEIDRHRHDEAAISATALRAAIAEEHEILPSSVVLVRQSSVPRTSSGKIQRRSCATALVEGTLPIVFEWKGGEQIDIDAVGSNDATVPLLTRGRLLAAPADTRAAFLEERMRYHVATVMQVPSSELDPDRPLVTMGIDSLMAVELKHRIESEVGVEISLLQLVDGTSLSELAHTVLAEVTGQPGDRALRASPVQDEAVSLLTSILSTKEPDS